MDADRDKIWAKLCCGKVYICVFVIGEVIVCSVHINMYTDVICLPVPKVDVSIGKPFPACTR